MQTAKKLDIRQRLRQLVKMLYQEVQTLKGTGLIGKLTDLKQGKELLAQLKEKDRLRVPGLF